MADEEIPYIPTQPVPTIFSQRVVDVTLADGLTVYLDGPGARGLAQNLAMSADACGSGIVEVRPHLIVPEKN